MGRTEVVVIGGGQAGLAVSHELTERGFDHVVLERDTLASAWRGRWDSFTLVTPNWTVRLPGGEYEGPEPDGFMARDEVVGHLERYARSFGAPVRTGIAATEVTERTDGYRVATTDGTTDAAAVVVATGSFQRPRRPNVGVLPGDILDLHSSEYRNPDQLPPGGVLVVGSGQSGAQLAEELHEAGRRVVLSVSRAPRFPRRYRGRDLMRWALDLGMFERTVDRLDDPAERFAANPHVSGKRGGHTLNLHRFARDGIKLAGRITAIEDSVVRFAPDLAANLAGADKVATEVRGAIDRFVDENGLDVPPATEENSDDYDGDDGFRQPQIGQLELRSEGISSVIWASGYGFDFSWIRPASLDDFGYPIQRRGVTDRPGLYFVGLQFLHTLTSGLLYGVGGDARHIADDIGRRLDR